LACFAMVWRQCNVARAWTCVQVRQNCRCHCPGMTEVITICVVVSRIQVKCFFGGSCAQRRTIARVGTGIPGPCMIRQPNLRGSIFGQFLFGFWFVPERMCSWGSRLFVGSLVFSGRRLPIPNTCCLVPRSHLSLANLAQGAPRPSSHTITTVVFKVMPCHRYIRTWCVCGRVSLVGYAFIRWLVLPNGGRLPFPNAGSPEPCTIHKPCFLKCNGKRWEKRENVKPYIVVVF